jgi:hypothetical protein
MCTIFADEARAREMLDHERTFMLRALERLRGRAEWSVKLLADQQTMRAAAAVRATAEAGSGSEGESPGRAFFARKKAERETSEHAHAVIVTAAEEVHERLRQQAASAVVLPPQNRELSQRSGEMILNGAYLVDESETDAFAALARELARRNRELGLELELSGPFAPYNFVTPREEVFTHAGEEAR